MLESDVQQAAMPEAVACAVNSHPCPVVAIGSSAGGLEAFQELFRHMPADSGLVFVLIQHLSPRHETLVPELLSPLTAMPVRPVTEEAIAEANHVYVMPASLTLTIDDGVLYASRAPRFRGRRSPIDRFFRSLAEDQEDEAVGIILSGTGADGALGLKAIKERGGLTIVQAPQTASYDGMPRSAVLTGAADYVLPIAEMPAKLLEHMARLRDGQGGSPERFREEVAAHLGKICAILRRETGHDFSRYKPSTLVRRVRRRLNESRCASVYDYVDFLNRDGREVEQLFRDLLISVTHFFRDPEVFDLLTAKVVPRLFAGKDADGFVRVWVPGCATGEEAYSLAILLRERLDGLAQPPQVQVFATDIDAQALEAARQACYPETIAVQMSPQRLERFFVKHGNMYQVCREIRDLCLFSLHNLIADPPFSRLDLVSCRNLLIYLESELQKKVLALFHYALRPGGFLFLGPSERVSGQPDLFRTLDKKHRIFQSRDTVARPPFHFPLGERTRLGHRQAEDSSGEAGAVAGPGVIAGDDPVVRRLEAELRATKDHLQATMEELESSNEELVSSNEELQTSKEELQSVNEELETVNAELKKKLEELDNANSDLQNLFQSTRIATLFVDRELRIKRFTPAATEVFRLIDSDVGRPIADIAPRFAGGDMVADIRKVLLTLSPRERQVGADEGSAWYLLRIHPYRTLDDVIDGVVLTFLDVTELKRAEAERSKLADIVESSQDGIIGKTLDGVVTSWNAGAERMYGYTAHEMIGRPIDVVVAPECRTQIAAVFEQLRRGDLVEPFETVRVRKDGQRFDISLTFSPVRDAAGRLVGASGIDRDISDRKRAEEALRMEARRKDEFLAMLGHELRNPLAPIRNSLHVLRSANASADQKARVTETIERQVVHLTRLVDDLLDISRISQGKILLRKQRVDLVETLRVAVEDLRPQMETAGLALELDLPGAPVWVTGDPTRLSQAIGNVLHNAIKFTERGGRISAEARGEPESGTVAVVVRDTGIGMDAELLARVFEPFSQAERGLDRGRGGLGLGLFLVKALAELHGGTVEAASAGLGQGSQITLRLPLAAREEENVMAERVRGDELERSRRCLVIEDHQDAAESLAMLLELVGHQAEVAFNAREGLAKAQVFRPDVILCDIGLPDGMDGYDVARALRADPELRSAYMIALTGYGQDEDRQRAMEAGFDAHLTKPADLDALRRLLATGGR